MTDTIQLTTVNFGELLDAIVQITRAFGETKVWWRGHADNGWRLAPKLYREGISAKERNMNQRFKMLAKVRHANCPGPDDALAWLFLMQHYGLPTRLLDWSESPLVALYFALEESVDDGVDAAVWGVRPTGLNQHQMGQPTICTPESKSLGRLGVEAFRRTTKDRDSRVLAVTVEQADLRQMMQQSAVTIHGTDTPIEDLPGAGGTIAKVRIPAESKAALRQVLRLLGISRENLFPDLENLAHEIAALNFEELS